jgi:hypothetical protein
MLSNARRPTLDNGYGSCEVDDIRTATGLLTLGAFAMKRRQLLWLAAGSLPMSACAQSQSLDRILRGVTGADAGPAATGGLTQADAAAGIRAALERGAVVAVSLLGRTDGFFGNPKVRIPLPPSLEQASGLLRTLGQQRRVDELRLTLNRAAEAAVPEARALLVDAARAMTVEDAVQVVRGGDTSVTDYFSRRTRAPLTERFLPIVTGVTERLALVGQYNQLAAQAASVGLVRQEEANVERYVTTRALDGLFLVIGEEERRIRQDPIGTGSEILRRVFGGR